jgi:hypothetical protein
MALFIQKNDERSELQQRLAAELQAKARAKAKIENDRVDGVKDSAYLQGTKQTTSLAWLWILVVAAIIGAAIFIIYTLSTR